jgi:hypothetical protein
MENIMKLAIMVVILSSMCWSEASLPEAPRVHPVADKRFWAVAGTSAGIVYADAFTTARIGQSGHCYYERQAPFLYGYIPSQNPARVYAVMSGELALAMAGSYWLKRKHSKLWFLPLLANGGMHANGAIHNFTHCQ